MRSSPCCANCRRRAWRCLRAHRRRLCGGGELRPAGVALCAREASRASRFAIPFVSYAFNFNLGATVGALGFRFGSIPARRRAETDRCDRRVLDRHQLVRLPDGLGAMLIADPSALHAGWGLSPTAGRLLGALALAPVAAYLIATGSAGRRSHPREPLSRCRSPGWRSPRSACQRLLAARPAHLYALAPPERGDPLLAVAVAYGLAALGGLVVRVPAGLGVIEAVFLEVFRGQSAPDRSSAC